MLERWWGRREDVQTPYPLWCRGNVGEVVPNVISLLGASLLMVASARGQERWALDTGMISRRQLVEHGWSMIEPFAGYLYVNVSLGRIAAPSRSQTVTRNPGPPAIRTVVKSSAPWVG